MWKTKWWLIYVLHLIDWADGTSFLYQSQANALNRFNTRVKISLLHSAAFLPSYQKTEPVFSIGWGDIRETHLGLLHSGGCCQRHSGKEGFNKWSIRVNEWHVLFLVINWQFLWKLESFDKLSYAYILIGFFTWSIWGHLHRWHQH